MTLKYQMAEDLLRVFLNPDDFGQEVDLDGRRVLAIVKDEGEGHDTDGTIEVRRPGVLVRVVSLYVRAADVDRPKPGRVLTLDGVQWTVSRVEDQDGMLAVQLWREDS